MAMIPFKTLIFFFLTKQLVRVLAEKLTSMLLLVGKWLPHTTGKVAYVGD